MKYTIKGYFGRAFMYACRLFPIQNKIVFSSFDGKQFGDNPKALFDEIKPQNIIKHHIVLIKRFGGA